MAKKNLTKICRKCQIEKSITEFCKDKSTKDGLKGHCRKCAKKLKQENKEKYAAQTKRYIQKNKARIAKRTKQYEQKNKKRIAEQRSQFYRANKARIAERSKRYRQENKSKFAERGRQYRQTEAGKAADRKNRYKRRVAKYNGIYEIFNPKEIFERDGWICQLCGKKTRSTYNQHHSLYPNLDHIIPLSRGGSHTRKNTQCSCRQCNIEKHNKIIGQLRMFG